MIQSNAIELNTNKETANTKVNEQTAQTEASTQKRNEQARDGCESRTAVSRVS
jgi:hypothetical protein